MGITKTEWEIILAQHGHCCAVCGIGEDLCGGLEKAHLQARSKGGSQCVPMCGNCHNRYDGGQLDNFELSKLGIDLQVYRSGKLAPNGRKPVEASSTNDVLGDILGGKQNEDMDKFLFG